MTTPGSPSAGAEILATLATKMEQHTKHEPGGHWFHVSAKDAAEYAAALRQALAASTPQPKRTGRGELKLQEAPLRDRLLNILSTHAAKNFPAHWIIALQDAAELAASPPQETGHDPR